MRKLLIFYMPVDCHLHLIWKGKQYINILCLWVYFAPYNSWELPHYNSTFDLNNLGDELFSCLVHSTAMFMWKIKVEE